MESLEQMASSLQETDSKELWATHSRMEDLVQDLKSLNSLETIHRATKEIERKLPPRGRLLVAETINGRQGVEYRSGLIFLSDELGTRDIAADFAKMARRFSEEAARGLSTDAERCRRATAKTEEIVKVLKLKTNEI